MATTRQVIAVKKISEIIGKYKGQKTVSLGKILIEAGYSPETAATPSLVTESKGFKDEMAKIGDFISDKKLLKAHTNLLGSSRLRHQFVNPDLSDKDIKAIVRSVPGGKLVKILRDDKKTKAVEIWYTIPIGGNVRMAVDLAYKLKGSYAPEKQKVDFTGELNVVEVTNYGDNPKQD